MEESSVRLRCVDRFVVGFTFAVDQPSIFDADLELGPDKTSLSPALNVMGPNA